MVSIDQKIPYTETVDHDFVGRKPVPYPVREIELDGMEAVNVRHVGDARKRCRERAGSTVVIGVGVQDRDLVQAHEVAQRTDEMEKAAIGGKVEGRYGNARVLRFGGQEIGGFADNENFVPPPHQFAREFQDIEFSSPVNVCGVGKEDILGGELHSRGAVVWY
jgi:hypothetical protein